MFDIHRFAAVEHSRSHREEIEENPSENIEIMEIVLELNEGNKKNYAILISQRAPVRSSLWSFNYCNNGTSREAEQFCGVLQNKAVALFVFNRH